MGKSRKHVTSSTRSDACRPPAETETIVKVSGLRGSNICEVALPDGSQTLCRIPNKFNKVLWIKTGMFVFVELGEADAKVSGELTHVLYADHVKQLKRQPGVWPAQFADDEVDDWGQSPSAGGSDSTPLEEHSADQPSSHVREDDNEDEEVSEDDDMPELQANPNRRRYQVQQQEDSDSDSD